MCTLKGTYTMVYRHTDQETYGRSISNQNARNNVMATKLEPDFDYTTAGRIKNSLIWINYQICLHLLKADSLEECSRLQCGNAH